jgi:hypothetical protein
LSFASSKHSLSEWPVHYALNFLARETRKQALYRAHTESALSMTATARALGLAVSGAVRMIAQAEHEQAKDKA